MEQQELMQIVYDNALGHIQEIKETIRRNKTKAHQLIILSFIAMGLIFQKIDFEPIKTHYWPWQLLFWTHFQPWQLLFWVGFSLWVVSLGFLIANHRNTSMDSVYTIPSKLLCPEFLGQSYTEAIEGLAISIGTGIKKMKKANRKLARNNFYGLILFITGFFTLFAYMMFA